jgi:hypothetical protein
MGVERHDGVHAVEGRVIGRDLVMEVEHGAGMAVDWTCSGLENGDGGVVARGFDGEGQEGASEARSRARGQARAEAGTGQREGSHL